FERDGALTDGGEAVFGVEDRGDAIGEAEPLQACGGEDDRGVVTLVETVEPRVDVAAKRLDPELRIALAQLRFATQARRADCASWRHLGERAMGVGHE